MVTSTDSSSLLLPLLSPFSIYTPSLWTKYTFAAIPGSFVFTRESKVNELIACSIAQTNSSPLLFLSFSRFHRHLCCCGTSNRVLQRIVS